MNAEQPSPNVPGQPVPRPVPPLPAADREKKEEMKLKEDYRELGGAMQTLGVAEAILKHPARVLYESHRGRSSELLGRQLLIAVVCLLAYGLTAGMFSWGTQLWAAPVKVTFGLLLSALICLPSLFVLSCLAGSESSLKQIAGTLAGLVTVSGLLLLAFGPVSWVFAQSTESIVFMGVLHLVFWAIAVYYGLQYLKKGVVLLNGHSGTHLALWSIVFLLVTLQMTSTLRPILGKSDKVLSTEKKFFLVHWADQLRAESERSVGID